MSELTKNVKPLDDFNWEEFENGSAVNVSKEELDKAYNETLNKVSEHQVTEGTVISCDKKEGYRKHRLQERWYHSRKRVPLQS